MNTCGIYGIRNMVSGKWYVGQSLNVEQRIRQHKADLRYKHHFNDHLQKAVIKYGLKNFAFRILEETPESMLDVRECAWIEYHKSIDQKYGYNQSTGGHLTRHHSKESLRKMSKSQKGRHHSKETRRRMSEANKRRPPPSEETCR